MKSPFLVFTVLCALLLTSGCNNDIFYQQRVDIPEGIWNHDRLVSFPFNVEDTTSTFDIFVEVDHDRKYAYQNLYTKIHTLFPGGDSTAQMVSLELSDGMGQWKGVCKGSECKRLIPLLTNTAFKARGPYKINFEQYSREENLQGIHSLRLEIIRSE